MPAEARPHLTLRPLPRLALQTLVSQTAAAKPRYGALEPPICSVATTSLTTNSRIQNGSIWA